MTQNRVVTELAQVAGNISIIRLVQNIIEEACEQRASDIHFDPQHTNLRVRYRIDGQLFDAHLCSKVLHLEIISRVKILAGLRTDEHQTPQDGRFRMDLENHAVDVRVSIIPTYYGENAVLRLLPNKTDGFNLESLGFTDANRRKINTALRKPYGIILTTGPTGSGKTSTLYTLLKKLNTKEASIVTIEDPIEYAMEGVRQIQVNPRTGLGFVNGLRSILRQDPDIVMVGEIRDAETAGIAINTALTGHLVLSTLHTNDAATTLPRLLDMKIESYLVAATVNIIISQRLVRKICSYCKTAQQPNAAEIKSWTSVIPAGFIGAQVFYYGKGCINCNGSGFKGRLGIHEVMVPDEKIREAILQKSSAGEIRKIAVAGGMSTIIEDGFLKVQAGLTTMSEILRMVYE